MTVGSGIYLIGFFPLRLPLAFLLLIFSVKFIFSALAPAFGLPGGMMFPVLALGGLTGKILVETMRLCGTPLSAEAGMVLIVAGMAAFFATVTDMPFVAFVLLLETTHCLAFLPVIFLSVSVSMVLCRFAGIRSVYEILYERSSFSRRTPLK